MIESATSPASPGSQDASGGALPRKPDVLLVHGYYIQPGGEDRVFETESALLQERGHRVIQFPIRNEEAVARRSRLGLALDTVWNASVARELRAMVRRQRPDIVHFHNTFPAISPAAYEAARSAGASVVQTLHNYRLVCPNGLLFRADAPCEACIGKTVAYPGIAHACYRGSRAATGTVATMLTVHRGLGTWSRAVDLYLAPTRFTASRLARGGLPTERLHVKSHFVDPDPGLGHHAGGHALFIGRLSAEKGIRTLLAAWRTMGPEFPLKIVGDGPEKHLMDSLPAGVEWLGSRNRSEVLELMRNAALLVVPSVAYETFGLTIAEAFATGLPVLASDHGAPAELVDHNKTGILFSAGNPTSLATEAVRLLRSPADRTRLGANARREYELRYDGEAGYRGLMDAYAIAARRRGGGDGRSTR